MEQQSAASTPAGPREVSEQDKRLAADWLKKIDAAQQRPQVKEAFKRFERNRRLLRGFAEPDSPSSTARIRSNLYFSQLATLRPQVYAKDPEFTVQPTKAVGEDKLLAARKFGETGEAVLTKMLVKDCDLKKRSKRLLTSAYTTAVGWWKLCWQEDKKTDPLIDNQIKDTQDNLNRLQSLRESLDDAGQADTDLQLAKLRETLSGLQGQAEITVSRGLTLDFVLSEDVLVLDDSIREIGDYLRSSALAHGVWMSRDQYKARFGYDCKKGKSYSERPGTSTPQSMEQQNAQSSLLRVWEIWDQQSNRVFHVCEGEEGFCCAPSTPDWTGKRWYPLFLALFNEVDGALYPLSDVELIEPLVTEYNQNRNDFVRDRKACLPVNIARKGGSLNDEDLKRIKDREGGDLIMVEGVGGQPIQNDIWSGQLGQINPANYDTAPARADIEQIVGGGDAARGSVLSAKTATEAEILAQGLRSRSAERQDTMEDLLTEVGSCALQMCLRKMTEAEVQRIAGAEAVWPQLSYEEVFQQVTVSVRGGSTGKPDRLQEQDRWTKLLPVIEKTMERVAQLRAAGQDQLAQAVVSLCRETLRRFDERLDLDTYLPEKKEGEGEQPDPAQAQQMAQQAQMLIQELQGQVQRLQKALDDKNAELAADVRKTEINAGKEVEVARVKAPIEAQAKVEAERVRAEAAAQARAEEAARQALEQPPAEPEPQEPEGPSEMAQVMAGLVESQARLQELLAQVMAPKPLRKIVHERDPKTNRLLASSEVLVPGDPAGE